MRLASPYDQASRRQTLFVAQFVCTFLVAKTQILGIVSIGNRGTSVSLVVSCPPNTTPYFPATLVLNTALSARVAGVALLLVSSLSLA
jgi:hypothetical protein